MNGTWRRGVPQKEKSMSLMKKAFKHSPRAATPREFDTGLGQFFLFTKCGTGTRLDWDIQDMAKVWMSWK